MQFRIFELLMTCHKKIFNLLLFITGLFCFNSNVFCSDDSTFVAATVYPNPFRTELTIQHNKCIDLLEEVAIYDAIGNTVYVFSKDQYLEDIITWDGTNLNGGIVNSGTYICHIRSSLKTESFLIQKQ